jgi:hypothetical protein
MEFAKTAQRIFRTRAYPGTAQAVRALVSCLRARIEQASPIPFVPKCAPYRRSGRLVRWARLRFALSLAEG